MLTRHHTPLGPYFGWFLASNILVRFFLIKKSRDGLLGKSVTRGHTLAHWQVYIGAILTIPLIMVKLFFRLVGSIFFNIMFIARIDTPVFSAGWEGWDSGYSVYVAFLLNDHEMSNPVLLSFCRHALLSTWTGPQEATTQAMWCCIKGSGGGNDEEDQQGLLAAHDGSDGDGSDGDGSDGSEAYADAGEGEGGDGVQVVADGLTGEQRRNKRSRARTRWFLALTLTRNPVLIPKRKHYLVKREKQSLAGRVAGVVRAGAAQATQAAGKRLASVHLTKRLSQVKSSVKTAILNKTDGGKAGNSSVAGGRAAVV